MTRRHDALMAVSQALTDGEGVEITHAAVNRGFPRERLPVPVAAVLDWLVEEDTFRYVTEPFFMEHDKDLDNLTPYGSAYAATALAALGRDLTVDAVRAVVARNVEPTPYDPVPDLAHALLRLQSLGTGYAPSLAAALSRLKTAGVGGTEDEIEAWLRALLEKRR